MKMLLIPILFLLSLNVFAQFGGFDPEDFEVEKVLFERVTKQRLKILEDTFIPNIQGYACPVPAINLNYIPWDVRLKHNPAINFAVTTIGLHIKNPNMQFCNWPDPKEIFGEEFEIGNELELELLVKRERGILDSKWSDSKEVVVETVSTVLLGRELISVAILDLETR